MKKITLSSLSFLLSVSLSISAQPSSTPWQCKYTNKTTGWICQSLPSVAKALGWIQRPNLCAGSFQEPADILGRPAPPPRETSTTTYTAKQGWFHFDRKSRSTIKGDVTIKQPGRTVIADTARFSRSKKTGKVSTIDLAGNVHLYEPGKAVVSESAHLDLEKHLATLSHAVYRIAANIVSNPPHTDQPPGWGTASHAKRAPSGLMTLHNATYTTCSPKTNVWHVKASKMVIDRKAGIGTARNARIYFKNLPVFYTPYLRFVLDKRRKSGFLMPTYGYSTDKGLELSTPYYWNMAPNYDATITPHLMSDRGLLWNGDFRFLTQKSYSTLGLGYIYDDAGFAHFKQNAANQFPARPAELARLNGDSSNRGHLVFKNNTRYNLHWHSAIEYNHVTDDYYFQDFSGNPVNIGIDALPQTGIVDYSSEHWAFSTRLLAFQMLHPINEPTVFDQYNRLPQLNLNGDYPDAAFGLDYNVSGEFVRFDLPDRFGANTPTPFTTGERAYLQPGITLPIVRAAGYVTPQLQLNLAKYTLHNQAAGAPTEVTRVLPLFNIDSGLYFDRSVHLWGRRYSQTLEPRAYYLWAPLTNQSNIPNFDTTEPPFAFAQLFRTNRFSGEDRIGDANQLSLALTTRFLDGNSALEKFHASLGVVAYFQDRRVQMPVAGNPTWKAPTWSDTLSPVVGELNYHFTPYWSTTATLAWDTAHRKTTNSVLSFYYSRNHRIVDLGYNYTLIDFASSSNLKTTYAAVNWPLKYHWSALGRLDYNITKNRAYNYFYGLEYDSCCWALRMVTRHTLRNTTASNQKRYENAYFVQLLLRGLGSYGYGDAHDLLTGNISGYNDPFNRKG